MDFNVFKAQILEAIKSLVESLAPACAHEGDLYAAASVAVEILSAVGEWYAEDEVYSDEDFDSENFCTSDAASLLIDILESGKLQEDSLEETVSDIRKASRLDAYRSYCILDMEELLFVADHAGLPPEKYISALTDRIDSDGRSRTKWLLREASFLRGREKEIVSHLAAKKSFFNRKEISGICAEEHMIPQLVESLRWDDFRSEECLESLKQYSGLLDGKQREGLVTSYVENLRMYAVKVNSSHYGRIRCSMELLRDSCPEGAAAVESLASEFCESYHRRPAFMREMRRLMSVR